ncbi:MAG: UTP--glucose-1-phosphate uridylyltransferase [Desulfobacterales bacterium]|nr:UTP--glucose-1-phosphate uridylyltransferase [Desulfobacterales bacterium]
MAENPAHLQAFIEKMKGRQMEPIVIDTFADYYRQVVEGETGLLSDRDISPVSPDELVNAEGLQTHREKGRDVLGRTIMIKLNGGLGTSMGLTGAKSLLEVKPGKSFLSVILRQAAHAGVELALMNSFSTHEDTAAAVEEMGGGRARMFLQHMFPKILREDLSPAKWPANSDLEWNPPGHGDIYTALKTSGLLDDLLAEGIQYAFISNSDNLGATLDFSLLGYFAENDLPFMMEVAERTPADTKGGHLARHENGRLILREVAQCPADEMEAFTDIELYRFFNTNNIWVNLQFLADLFSTEKSVRLPIILNPKPIDPRDENSPPVFQIETAMGAAISLFEGASAVQVPKSRLIPVKKCSDLLVLRSDYILLEEGDFPRLNPKRATDRIRVDLDPNFYKKIDRFNERFAAGAPSLAQCESLTVRGDVYFEAPVTVKGRATVIGRPDAPTTVASGTVLSGELTL